MGSDEVQPDLSDEASRSRKPWVPMDGECLGRLADLVLSGGAKPMISLGDPGEPTRKPSGDPA
jgi:hypothetical protein